MVKPSRYHLLASYDETTRLNRRPKPALNKYTGNNHWYLVRQIRQKQPLGVKLFLKQICLLPTSTSDEESSKTQSLQGTGIEFGYDFEKYSCPSTNSNGAEETTSLQAQMLLFRYFLPYALSVGGGFASAKLDTEFGSDSGTAPVFHFGYDYPITKNFQISLSYTWLGVNLAVQDTQSVTPPSPSTIQKRAVIGMVRRGGQPDNNYSAIKRDGEWNVL